MEKLLLNQAFSVKVNEAFENYLVEENKHIRKCRQPQRSSTQFEDKIKGLIFVTDSQRFVPISFGLSLIHI